MTKVIFTDWRLGFQKVKFTQLLRDRCGLGLAAAHSVTGTLLQRQPVEVEVADATHATELVRQAADLGAIGLVASASSESCSALTV